MRVKKINHSAVRAIISMLSFFILFVFLLELVSDITVPKVNRLRNGLKFYTSTGYCSEPENSIDAVILGNSNAYCGVSPMEIWNSHGYTVYNCGEPLLRMSDIYYRLVDVLNNQSPSVVLIETDAFYSIGTKSDDLNQTIASNLSYIFPVFEYHDRWKSLHKEDFYFSPNYFMHISAKGYVFSRSVAPFSGDQNYMQTTPEPAALSVTAEMYFDLIYNLCRENGIQIVLFCVPSPTSWNYAKHLGVMQLAERYELPFLDVNLFYEDIGLSLETDTRDGGNHLNHSGAVKISAYLGAYLSDFYALTDHRSDEAYRRWNEDYLIYTEDIKNNIQSSANQDAVN